MPWPLYDDVVKESVDAASQECWSDYDYVPDEAGRMLPNEEGARWASLDEIKTMPTFCVRAERFCDGHWGAMIEGGHRGGLLSMSVHRGMIAAVDSIVVIRTCAPGSLARRLATACGGETDNAGARLFRPLWPWLLHC